MDISGCPDSCLNHNAYLSSLKMSTSSWIETSSNRSSCASPPICSNEASEHPMMHRPIIVPEFPSRIREDETRIRSSLEIRSGRSKSLSPKPIHFNSLSDRCQCCEQTGRLDEPRSNALKFDQAM